MQQLLIVRAPFWEATEATLFALEDQGKGWTLASKPMPVTLGLGGLGWGRGLHEDQPEGPVKKEGDMRSPAGIFPLIAAFGYEWDEKVAMPYILVDEELECVDDPHSTYYNQFVKGTPPDKDWKSSEKMLQKDGIYERGIVVGHNMSPPLPGAGSCIFMHKWRKPGAPTAGCTGTSKKHLHELLYWLDPQKQPLLIQLPEHLIKKIVPWLS